MPSALVLGVNGQDGSYLAESLLARGYRVTGAGRQPASRYVPPSASFRYVALDLTQRAPLDALLREMKPDCVFHAAAIHGASGFSYEPVWNEMVAVNVTSVHTVLEYARTSAKDLRLVYASSAKVFPNPLSGRIDESTPMKATCLYSIGKLATLELIREYRTRHRIAGANLFTFNHESVRRGPEYFLPTIARCVKRAKQDRQAKIRVKTLQFRTDWSNAAEFMDIAVDVAEKSPAEDFVLASGTTWLGRDAVDKIFARHGLEAARHVEEELRGVDPGPPFSVALDKLQAKVGRVPHRDILPVVDDMIAQAS